GALTFSLVKHVGLGFLGCLIVAITAQNSPLWEGLAGAFLLTGLVTVLGAHIIPQVVYRKTTGQGLAVLVPVFLVLSLFARPLTWGVEFLQRSEERRVGKECRARRESEYSREE